MTAPVSVLVPAYNRADLIGETLDSILSQTLAPAQLIVVDDGSRDGTREAVLRFGSRVDYHYQKNGGICNARNTAVALSSSPYIAFCDHDDLWRRDKLEQQMDLLQSNSALEYCFTNFSFVSDGAWSERSKMEDAPSDFFSPPPPSSAKTYVSSTSLYGSLLRFQPIWPSTVLMSRRFFDRLGGFLEEFGKNPSEDLEFTLRCVHDGPVGVVLEPVVGVRRHPGNYSGSDYRNVLGQIEILEYALDRHPVDDSLRLIIRREIDLRRVEAAYGAFQLADFPKVVSLASRVPSGLLDFKSQLKLWISRLPAPLARTAHKLLVKPPTGQT